MPARYTCDGDDIIPPLRFQDVPDNSASLALIMDDPDAPMGTFDHWIVWNIPPTTQGVEEGREPPGVQGRTGFGANGYGGPCPPGGTHRYFFRLYSLDVMLDCPPGSGKRKVMAAMEGHVIDEAVLMAKYSRR